MLQKQPFTFQVNSADGEDLKRRLQHTRWPTQQPIKDWSWGVPVSYLKQLLFYWGNSFDWRIQREELNAFSQFITEIDGKDLHFIHVSSDNLEAKPLLLYHGYSGSVVDFLHDTGPLTHPEEKHRAVWLRSHFPAMEAQSCL